MKTTKLADRFSVSDQIQIDDLATLANAGIEVLVCNRPDKESADQPDFELIRQEASKLGMDAHNIPFLAGQLNSDQVAEFDKLYSTGKTLLAYCRTGNRCTQLWKAWLERTGNTATGNVQSDSASNTACVQQRNDGEVAHFDLVVIGAGSGGIAVVASLLKRRSGLRIALVDPSDTHDYQPGWTMVGGGVFKVETTRKPMRSVIPTGANWIQASVDTFDPESSCVRLSNDSKVHYNHLVVAAGLKLDWDGIDGLTETLGKNGVTSNYRFDLAPYTWELVTQLQSGRALFTQPPMPIKCAGAPQKALYLSADYWRRQKRIPGVEVHFFNAGAVLFGVADYVPALNRYMDRYQAERHFNHKLTRVDGSSKTAWFETTGVDGSVIETEEHFDMLHVCPPQCAPDFIRESQLCDPAGWLDVDKETLQHVTYANIWGLGDVTNTPNAKTMAAARKQAPVLAQNICSAIDGKPLSERYDGYGSCPLTVERGKIVLAEFCYGGKVSPSFPAWLNKGTEPTAFAWHLKASFLPAFYWHGMLKGREWMTQTHPERLATE